jgi:hypothetical protein
VAVVVLRSAMPKMCRPGWSDVVPDTDGPTSGRVTEVTVQAGFTGTANA